MYLDQVSGGLDLSNASHVLAARNGYDSYHIIRGTQFLSQHICIRSTSKCHIFCVNVCASLPTGHYLVVVHKITYGPEPGIGTFSRPVHFFYIGGILSSGR